MRGCLYIEPTYQKACALLIQRPCSPYFCRTMLLRAYMVVWYMRGWLIEVFRFVFYWSVISAPPNLVSCPEDTHRVISRWLLYHVIISVTALAISYHCRYIKCVWLACGCAFCILCCTCERTCVWCSASHTCGTCNKIFVRMRVWHTWGWYDVS